MKPSLLLGKDTHRELHDLLRKEGRLVVSGASNETAKALLLSHLLSFQTQKTLLVTQNDASSEALSHWLSFFGQKTHTMLPVRDAEGSLLPEHLQGFLLFMEPKDDESRENAPSDIFVISRDAW